jgi:hypothetical protein
MKILVTAVALAAAFPAAAQTAPAGPPAHDEQARHRQHPRDCPCPCCEHMAGQHREHSDDHAPHRGDDGQSD